MKEERSDGTGKGEVETGDVKEIAKKEIREVKEIGQKKDIGTVKRTGKLGII